MQILDGKKIAADWRTELVVQTHALLARGVRPGLAVVLVGDDPASLLYTSMKEKISRSIGFRSEKIALPKTASTEDVRKVIERLNADREIDGILVQLPLPDQIETDQILEAIDPRKDVDGLHPKSLGDLLIGHELVVPATPKGMMRLLEAYRITTEGKHVVIVGRSNILGKPLAALFLNRNATVTICHSKTTNLEKFTHQADLVVMDTGVVGLLRAAMIRPGAIVIDAGISRDETGQIVGDVRFDEVAPKAGAITPVPGGVGPMTIAALLDTTIQFAARRV